MIRPMQVTSRTYPGLGRCHIALCLGRGPGLGSHDEQCPLGLQPLKRLLQIMAVHIGHHMHTRPALTPGLQCLQQQFRPQARATNADMHHIRKTGLFTQLLRQSQHGAKAHMAFVLWHGAALRHQRSTQAHMQGRALLGFVHHGPGIQGIAPLRQTGLPGQLQQGLQHSLVPQGFGAIQQNMRCLQAQTLKPARAAQCLLQIQRLLANGSPGFQRLPNGCIHTQNFILVKSHFAGLACISS